MYRVRALAMLTFKEGIRDRALFGITIIGFLMLLATIVITSLYGHDLGKVLIDLNLSTIAFSGLLLTFFVNINLMAKDMDKRTVYSVLSKPISRTEYTVGKYLGLVLLTVTALSVLSLFSAGVMLFVKGLYAGHFFNDFSWAGYFQAVYYELLMFLILNAVVLFFSSICTSSFLTFLFSVGTYITGQTVEEVLHYFKQEMMKGETPSRLNQMIVDGAQYIFPNLSAFDIKTLASHGKLLSAGHTFALTGYSLFYSFILLFLASMIFSRRELH